MFAASDYHTPWEWKQSYAKYENKNLLPTNNYLIGATNNYVCGPAGNIPKTCVDTKVTPKPSGVHINQVSTGTCKNDAADPYKY